MGPPSLGLNLRVTGHCNQGGRKYMEDAFVVAYQQSGDQKDLEYAYFGIFDGHGGREAALFAKEHLMNNIVCQKAFWSEDDNQVLKAIREGFLATHHAMWREVGKWPKTVSGQPSTSGTTSSIAFIRRRKLFIGHVGDSKIVLGYQLPGTKDWCSCALTKDHKPETPEERKRIKSVGGLVLNKAGVERVVWNRPRPGHKGPIRRSTPFDQIPFLAVARSLGDLWSYNHLRDEFVVSPDPDLKVISINPQTHRCVIFASDGLWNMLSVEGAVKIVQSAEDENEKIILEGVKQPNNPSKILVDTALRRWSFVGMRADNTSVVTVMLDPPGPPKSEVLLRQKVMKRLRPRDEQMDDFEVEAKVVLTEGTMNRLKKATEFCESPLRDRKRSLDSTHEPPSKVPRLSSDFDDLVPKNLPAPVILSPQRVALKQNVVYPKSPEKPTVLKEKAVVENRPQSSNASVEEKSTVEERQPPARIDLPKTERPITLVRPPRMKKSGHDPPREGSNPLTKTEEKFTCPDLQKTEEICITDTSQTSLLCETTGETDCPGLPSRRDCNVLMGNEDKVMSTAAACVSSTSPRTGESSTYVTASNENADVLLPKTDLCESKTEKSENMSNNSNGRVHLCEVDNFFKLNERTSDSVIVKQTKTKNRVVVTRMKRRRSSVRRTTCEFPKAKRLGRSFCSPTKSVTRRSFIHNTRAQMGLRKMKV